MPRPSLSAAGIGLVAALVCLAAMPAQATDYVSNQNGDWATTTIWTPNGTPGSSDNVTVAHNVTSASARTVTDLTVNSGGALGMGTNTLTVSGNLTVNGSITGTGTLTLSGANKTIDGTGSVANPVTVSGGAKTVQSTASITFSGNITYQVTTTITNNGIVTVGGNIERTSSYTPTWTQGSNSVLNIAGTLLSVTGTLNASTSGNAVNYTGTGAQTVKATTYHHLGKSGAGTATMSATLTANGNLTITGGTYYSSNGFLTVNGATSISGTLTLATGADGQAFGDVTVSTGGVFDNDDTYGVTISGNLSNSSTFDAGTAQYTFNGTGKTISGAGTATFGGNIYITGTINITGTLTQTANMVYGTSTGALRVTGTTADVTFYNVNQNSSYPWKFYVGPDVGDDPTVTINNVHTVYTNGGQFNLYRGTVNYEGLGTTTSSALYLYGYSSGTGGWFATGGTANFKGNIYYDHVSTSYYIKFKAASPAKVKFVGSTNSDVVLVDANSAAPTGLEWEFGDLVVDKSPGYAVTMRTVQSSTNWTGQVKANSVTVDQGSLVLGGRFTASPGYGFGSVVINDILNVQATGTNVLNNDLSVSGDWTADPYARFYANSHEVTFTGASASVITGGTGTYLPFYDLEVAKTGAGVNLAADQRVEHNVTVTSGTFAIDDHQLVMGTTGSAGSVTVNGTFSAVASTDALTRVSALNSNYPYSFAVNSGGAIAAKGAFFERFNSTGIEVKLGATVDGTDNFSGCTFNNYGVDGTALVLDNDQALTITGPVFNGTPGSDFNIKKSGGTQHVAVMGASGSLAGEVNELDPAGPNPSGLIDWSVIDVSLEEILAPTGTYEPGTITPEVKVKNHNTIATVSTPVYVRIVPQAGGPAVWEREETVGPIGPGATLQYMFGTGWNATAGGSFTVKCSTKLAGDADPDNDFKGPSPFSVRKHDVAVTGILRPAVSTGRGEAVFPKVTVQNVGDVPETFNVEVLIETSGGVEQFRKEEQVTALAPGAPVEFTFTANSWTPTVNGAYKVTATAKLGDENPGNDVQGPNAFTVVEPKHDVGVTEILVPGAEVAQGTAVYPKLLVKNFGQATEDFMVEVIIETVEDGIVFQQEEEVTDLGPGAEEEFEFAVYSWSAADLGSYTVAATSKLAGDEEPLNDAAGPNAFTVIGVPGLWEEVKSMPTAPTPEKAPKDGAWLVKHPGTDAEPVLYVAKGYKTTDFYMYDPAEGDSGTWYEKAAIPATEGTKTKPPSKGCVGVSDGEQYVYMTKGNNTLGFWRYDALANQWDSMAGVPLGNYRKKVKGGTDMVFAEYKDTGCVYLLKGYKTEFYRYNPLAARWDTLQEVPYGLNKQKYDKGSFLAFDEARGYIYAHQAKYYDKTAENPHHYMFHYDVEADSWYHAPLKGMPIYGLENGRDGKKKKSADGAAGAWAGDNMYALKGGNTQGFYKYFPGSDAWVQLDTVPGNGTYGKKKRVKAGGDLGAYSENVFYAMKGNKAYEVWRYVEGTLYASRNTQYARSGVQAGLIVHRSSFIVSPNPLVSGWATLRYSLPKAGPVSITVFDVAGRSVLSQAYSAGRKASSVSLDLRKLAAGVYLVRLDADGQTATQKLVVQR